MNFKYLEDVHLIQLRGNSLSSCQVSAEISCRIEVNFALINYGHMYIKFQKINKKVHTCFAFNL